MSRERGACTKASRPPTRTSPTSAGPTTTAIPTALPRSARCSASPRPTRRAPGSSRLGAAMARTCCRWPRAFPQAHFVGCDFSALLMGRARATAVGARAGERRAGRRRPEDGRAVARNVRLRDRARLLLMGARRRARRVRRDARPPARTRRARVHQLQRAARLLRAARRLGRDAHRASPAATRRASGSRRRGASSPTSRTRGRPCRASPAHLGREYAQCGRAQRQRDLPRRPAAHERSGLFHDVRAAHRSPRPRASSPRPSSAR